MKKESEAEKLLALIFMSERRNGIGKVCVQGIRYCITWEAV